jgi:uncharacterized damage-inducible protein DinB
MTRDDARLLIEYNRWANQRVCRGAGELSSSEFVREMGGSYGSVRTTLVHMLWAEWLWLQRWQRLSPKERFAPEDFATQQAIDTRWAEIYRQQCSVLSALTERLLAERVSYENFQGETWTYSRAHMLQHVVNHSTHHRGQVVAYLRQLGRIPSITDFLVYLDEGAPEG